jgi:hypothetical protein
MHFWKPKGNAHGEVASLQADVLVERRVRERTSAVKHQNWDSAPLHKLIKNFPLFARPLA